MSNSLIKIIQPNYSSPTLKPSLSVPTNIVVGSSGNALPAAISGLSNLRTYYDASNSASVTTSGGLITTIADLSSHSTDGNTVGGSQPAYTTAFQNGLNVITMDANSIITIQNSIYDTPQASLGFVFKTPASWRNKSAYLFNAPGVPVNNPLTNYDFYFDEVTNGLAVMDAGQQNFATWESDFHLATNTWYRAVVVWDATLSDGNLRGKLYLNGVNHTLILTDQGYGNNQSGLLATLGYGKAADFSLITHIGEFVYTNGAITQAQVTALDAYWTSKWSI